MLSLLLRRLHSPRDVTMQYSSPQTSSVSAITKHWPAFSCSSITACCQDILRILI